MCVWFGANVKSLNFPQENVSSQKHTVGPNSLDRNVSWGRKKNPARFRLASWLCLASRERLMRTLIRSIFKKIRHWVWPEANKMLPLVGSTYIITGSLWSPKDVKVLVTLYKYWWFYHSHYYFLKNLTQLLRAMPNEKFQKTFWAMSGILNTDTYCQHVSAGFKMGISFTVTLFYYILHYIWV